MYHSRNRLPKGLTPADVNLMDNMPKQALYAVALQLAEGSRDKLLQVWSILHDQGTVPQPPRNPTRA